MISKKTATSMQAKTSMPQTTQIHDWASALSSLAGQTVLIKRQVRYCRQSRNGKRHTIFLSLSWVRGASHTHRKNPVTSNKGMYSMVTSGRS